MILQGLSIIRIILCENYHSQPLKVFHKFIHDSTFVFDPELSKGRKGDGLCILYEGANNLKKEIRLSTTVQNQLWNQI